MRAWAAAQRASSTIFSSGTVTLTTRRRPARAGRGRPGARSGRCDSRSPSRGRDPNAGRSSSSARRTPWHARPDGPPTSTRRPGRSAQWTSERRSRWSAARSPLAACPTVQSPEQLPRLWGQVAAPAPLSGRRKKAALAGTIRKVTHASLRHLQRLRGIRDRSPASLFARGTVGSGRVDQDIVGERSTSGALGVRRADRRRSSSPRGFGQFDGQSPNRGGREVKRGGRDGARRGAVGQYRALIATERLAPCAALPRSFVPAGDAAWATWMALPR